jgi:hypothetical protein
MTSTNLPGRAKHAKRAFPVAECPASDSTPRLVGGGYSLIWYHLQTAIISPEAMSKLWLKMIPTPGCQVKLTAPFNPFQGYDITIIAGCRQSVAGKIRAVFQGAWVWL